VAWACGHTPCSPEVSGLVPSTSKDSTSWLPEAIEALRVAGCAVVTDVLDAPFLQATRAAMYAVQDAIARDVGAERLVRAGEVGVLRLMLRYDPLFFRFLELPEVLAVVDATVSPTAILHLQNGFILPDTGGSQSAREAFQSRFHQDFPRVLGGYCASVNVLFAIDAFHEDNGATWVVPGSHQRLPPPPLEVLDRSAVPATCPAGSMVLFDSTLWHRGGENRSGADRLAINHQFTRSFLKQQIDYVRALGDAAVLAQRPRTQQLLGWYTRVVTSLDEYYRPEEERLYRKGQG
jgi:ectoine hydroxylase-related dioxygenase (phytanoyl-CoA dioxygenase family)